MRQVFLGFFLLSSWFCRLGAGAGSTDAVEQSPLPDTALLDMQGDLAAQMVEGIDRFLLRKTEEAATLRNKYWHRDTSSPENYEQSIEVNRERFGRIIGVVNRKQKPKSATRFEHTEQIDRAAYSGTEPGCVAEWVRWPVHDVDGAWSTEGEGLLLTPIGRPHVADVIALPDADTRPSAFVPLSNPGVGSGIPLRLAYSGCRVLVPLLIDRADSDSLVGGQRRTNQPHREFVYRQAYELGTHLIGYEVEKILSAIDCFEAETAREDKQMPKGVFGYGEGGLLAFYAAAIDRRIQAVGVSGYFDSRQQLWQEPIYRNVFSLLTEFGDAEIATLIAPRALIIEACRVPEVTGPPISEDGMKGAAPGRLRTPALEIVQTEAARARALVEGLDPAPVIEVIASDEGNGPPGTEAGVKRWLEALAPGSHLAKEVPTLLRPFAIDEGVRHHRLFEQLVQYTQHLMREAEYRRKEFWSKADAGSIEAWQKSTDWYRDYFANEVIGRFDEKPVASRPRTRLIYDEPKYRGYEVVLDVFPEVFAYGILLVPKGIAEGERRPVVVCQHGLEGRPTDVADPALDHPAYHRYACQLAERGFVTYAPQNPYIGRDNFRTLQRKANPLKKSLFSVIVPQHEAAAEWLANLPFVDPDRIAFYGLSYGGKSAMRVPALVERYCLSICSADFNEWIWKNTSSRSRYSYLGTDEYEMCEFDLGNTFNYAEMSALIAPRPFMVERGHHDNVAPDEWVAYEYAKVRRLYAALKIPERTTIEFFDGPHTIHGVGTFKFLSQQLKWPVAP